MSGRNKLRPGSDSLQEERVLDAAESSLSEHYLSFDVSLDQIRTNPFGNESTLFPHMDKSQSLDLQFRDTFGMNDLNCEREGRHFWDVKVPSFSLESREEIEETSEFELWREESSLQSFVYNLHNAKYLLDLVDDIFKRKGQNRMIMALTKIKAINKSQMKLVPTTRSTPSTTKGGLLIIRALLRKRLSQSFRLCLVAVNFSAKTLPIDRRENHLSSWVTPPSKPNT